MLHEEIEALREQGLLGEDVLGTGRRLTLEIFTSPGGYILGEESALLECMEGHRGEPRNKPPFPAIYGLWGKPTLMNSVETFADVPIIVERGADWWKEQGTNGATGLKFFAVSGHVEKPAVYCVRAGATTRELIELAGGVTGGREVGGFQPGGASSNFLGPEHLDVPLDWKPLQEAGLDARLWRADRDGRGHEHARRGHERAALLPQRVVRQVRPVPRRLDEGAHDPQRARRAGQGRRTTSTTTSSSSRRRCA